MSATLDTMTGDELRRLREKADVSQAKLAELAEVTIRTISRWENGEVDIPALAARGLREILAEKGRGKK